MLWNEENSEKPTIEGPYKPNKRECAASMATTVSKKAIDVILRLELLREMLLNSIEQLSIVEIDNQRNRLACETQIERMEHLRAW